MTLCRTPACRTAWSDHALRLGDAHRSGVEHTVSLTSSPPVLPDSNAGFSASLTRPFVTPLLDVQHQTKLTLLCGGDKLRELIGAGR